MVNSRSGKVLTGLSFGTVTHEVASVATSVTGAFSVLVLSTVSRHMTLSVTDVAFGERQVVRCIPVVFGTVNQFVVVRSALVADVTSGNVSIGTVRGQMSNLTALVTGLAAALCIAIPAHVTSLATFEAGSVRKAGSTATGTAVRTVSLTMTLFTATVTAATAFLSGLRAVA